MFVAACRVNVSLLLQRSEMCKTEGQRTMANTYSQIYVQVVFAVQGRQNLIHLAHKEEIYKYITGIIRNKSRS
jgi:hypothetical protein